MNDKDLKRQKMHGTPISMDEVLKELGWVKWPPKEEGEECMCGCMIKNGRFLCCPEHQPHPL